VTMRVTRMVSGRRAGALRRGLGSNAASSSILEPSTRHVIKTAAAYKRPPTYFVVTLRTRPGTDSVRALRALLKVLGRYHRLQCVGVREVRQ
jgi:hypothetical protein